MSRTYTNATGRNDVKPRRRAPALSSSRTTKRKPNELFVKHTLELLSSPAWRELSLAARNCLNAIEIEMLSSGNKGNGQLVCTYDQLVAHGIRRNSIRPALEELVALGLLEITVRGHAAATDLNFPNQYRLTYIRGFDGPEPTDEWRAIRTTQDANAAKRRASEALALEREEKRQRRLQRKGLNVMENRS